MSSVPTTSPSSAAWKRALESNRGRCLRVREAIRLLLSIMSQGSRCLAPRGLLDGLEMSTGGFGRAKSPKRWRATHDPQVAGSNPAPAITGEAPLRKLSERGLCRVRRFFRRRFRAVALDELFEGAGGFGFRASEHAQIAEARMGDARYREETMLMANRKIQPRVRRSSFVRCLVART